MLDKLPRFIQDRIHDQASLIEINGNKVRVDPRFRLSDHFTYREMVRSDIALRNGLDNNVTDLMVLSSAIAVSTRCLEAIRLHFNTGFKPSSWYRGELVEKYLNHAHYMKWCANSRQQVNDQSWAMYLGRKSHPKGEAVDIEVPGVPNDVLYEWCKTLQFDQLIREFPTPNDPQSGWVHISYSLTLNRRQILVIK